MSVIDSDGRGRLARTYRPSREPVKRGPLRIAVQARGAISVHARGAAQISAPSFPIRALRALKGQSANVPAYREVFR